ncbi:hypothetical protein T492DRAFT_927821 [Pavlovales sp. CCMP2436]|nr:hypothetical protein T492DRAFT_927821 [Pavlovales sp. CCMP2436]
MAAWLLVLVLASTTSPPASASVVALAGRGRRLSPLAPVLGCKRWTVGAGSGMPEVIDAKPSIMLARALRLRGGDWRSHAKSASTAMLLFSSATGSFGGAMRGGVEQMDLIGCIIMGVVAGVGGGTLRDLLLGVPVYWTYLRIHLYICVFCSMATFFLWPRAMRFGVTGTHLVVLYADAIALASGAVMGAHIGHQQTHDPVLTVVIGAVTALFGGIFVDLFSSARPRVLHADKSMYATPALSGMLLYVLLVRCPMIPQALVIVASFVLALVLRVLAWTYRLRNPRWTVASTGFVTPRFLGAMQAEREGPIAMRPGQRIEVKITTRPPSGRT